MSVPTCACTVVYYQPIDNGDGTLTERWHCSMCGRLFVKAAERDALLAQAERLAGALDALSLNEKYDDDDHRLAKARQQTSEALAAYRQFKEQKLV